MPDKINPSPLNEQPADIILLYPKTGMDLGGHTIAPPHSLLAVAAPVHRAGYTVKIIDMRVDFQWRRHLQQSVGSNTICIGISSMTGNQLFFALLMAREARRLTDGRIPLVWGGPHPTVMPEQTARHELVDVVVVGEGEDTFFELVHAMDHRQPLNNVPGLAYKDGSTVVMTPPRPLLDMEALLPVPWELIDVEDYISADNYFLKNSPRTLDIGQTSRGCPHRCGFCSSAAMRGRRWRAMSVEKSLEMILDPVRRFNLSGVWIRDDEFYVQSSRAFSICEKIVAGKNPISWYTTGSRVDDFNRWGEHEIDLIKKSGCYITKFGAESGSDRILDLINKGFHVEDTLKANQRCKKHGIVPAYSLVIGFPTQTFEEINQTIDLGFRLQAENPAAQLENMAAYIPLPETPLWPLAVEEGLITPDSLEGWTDWTIDEYDLEGRRLAWYNDHERNWIGNISYLSILSNAVGNLGGGIQNKLMRAVFLNGLKPLQPYYRSKMQRKRYQCVPELTLARAMRRRIFSRNERNFR